MIPKIFSFPFLTFMFLIILQEYAVLSKITETSAFIYEKDNDVGNVIEYAKSMTKWNDIPSLLQAEGFPKLGFLCVTGPFLLYKQAFYNALDESEMRLYSGINACVEPGSVNSIQLATGFGNIFKPTLSIFPETMLRGPAFAVSRASYNMHKEIGKAESLIIFGKKGFTVKTTMTKTFDDPYCLMPMYPEGFKFPICFLSDFRNQLFNDSKEFKYISPGCRDKSVKVNITNCVDFGDGEYDPVGPIGPNGTVPDDSPIKGCDDNEEFLSLLDLRLNNDFESHYQMRYPKDKSLYWRTALVDSAFDVVIGTCTKDPLNMEFLQIMREIFIYLIENRVWSKEGETAQNQTDDKLDSMVLQTDKCFEHIHSSSMTLNLMDEVSNTLHELDENQTIFDMVRPEFQTVEGNDLTMETVWYIGNLVLSMCHVAFGPQHDFWTEFYLMFWEMYLNPLVEHWKNPQKFLTYYHVLFGGYRVIDQIDSLALCVSHAFEISHLDPYPRPDGVVSSVPAS